MFLKSFYPLLITSCLLLGACSYFSGEAEKAPLPGERISILDLESELKPNSDEQLSIEIPPTLNNEDWPQSSGYPHHAMQNLAMGTGSKIEPIWHASIGTGSTSRIPLNAEPIVAAGKVFSLDGKSKLRAFHNQTGKLLWEQNVKSEKEDEAVISGGLAYSGGVLFVTPGYNEVLAVNPENGEIYWRSKISAGSRAAPTVLNGRVFVTTLNNNIVAFDASNGKSLWEYEGVGETTGLLGAASPAANDEIVVPAFSSGDIMALRVENGSVVWEDSLANSMRLGGMEGLSDIRGNPVITEDRVFAVSYGNKMAAFDKNNGNRLWQREISSTETPWVAGNAVYVLTPEHKLVALDISNGNVLWLSELEKFENPSKRDGLISWTGPIMANDRLILGGSGGRVLVIDPLNGKELRRWDAGADISIAPIVAGGTLYIITDDGKLTAYR